jgi:hypothetical protein
MIYKFQEDFKLLEVELFNEDNQSMGMEDNVCFSIKDETNEQDEWVSISIKKKDVYHLIGALHLLHKEMK